MSVVGDPGCGSTGSVEHREKNQDMLECPIQFQGPVRQSAVIADGGPEAAQRNQNQSRETGRETRYRVQHESDNGEHMNGDEIEEDGPFARGRLPYGAIPRMVLYRGLLLN